MNCRHVPQSLGGRSGSQITLGLRQHFDLLMKIVSAAFFHIS